MPGPQVRRQSGAGIPHPACPAPAAPRDLADFEATSNVASVGKRSLSLCLGSLRPPGQRHQMPRPFLLCGAQRWGAEGGRRAQGVGGDGAAGSRGVGVGCPCLFLSLDAQQKPCAQRCCSSRGDGQVAVSAPRASVLPVTPRARIHPVTSVIINNNNLQGGLRAERPGMPGSHPALVVPPLSPHRRCTYKGQQQKGKDALDCVLGRTSCELAGAHDFSSRLD